jgi:hypothetical protein
VTPLQAGLLFKAGRLLLQVAFAGCVVQPSPPPPHTHRLRTPPHPPPPCSGQVRLLTSLLARALPEGCAAARRVTVSTVDGYQGREADAVIFSTVRWWADAALHLRPRGPPPGYRRLRGSHTCVSPRLLLSL